MKRPWDLDKSGAVGTADLLSLLAQWGSDPGAVVGDLDGDGTVGITDLLILLGSWGACADCENCPADLDGDCTVGILDLLTLLANWSPR